MKDITSCLLVIPGNPLGVRLLFLKYFKLYKINLQLLLQFALKAFGRGIDFVDNLVLYVYYRNNKNSVKILKYYNWDNSPK